MEIHSVKEVCKKVERGEITIQEATDRFEKARKNIIEKKRFEAAKDGDGV